MDIGEIVGETDGQSKGALFFASLTGLPDFLKNRELVIFKFGKRGIVANGKVCIAANTTKENAKVTEIIDDNATDFVDDIRRFVGLGSKVVVVIDDDDAKNLSLLFRVAFDVIIFGAILENEQTRFAEIFDLIITTLKFDFDNLVNRGVDEIFQIGH